MEKQAIFGCGSSVTSVREMKLEEEDDDFRSCCEDDDDLNEREESAKEGLKNNLDEYSVNMFFKGISITEAPGDGGAGLSGIGVVMDRSDHIPPIQVQKKLDFFVDENVAGYLALMDGMLEAEKNKITGIFAFTDSEILYDQIINEEKVDNPLLLALRQRILERTEQMEAFVLKLVPRVELERPLSLARVAVGIISNSSDEDDSFETCSICCDEKPVQMMITMKCSHKFCSHCMKTYVHEKLESCEVPIRCPQLKCKYYISTTECKSFLPVASYQVLEKALTEENFLNSDKISCPFPNCSVLLDPRGCLGDSCLECPVCQRLICIECGFPWHTSMSCTEYQNLPMEARDVSDITLDQLAQNNRWRRCQHCLQMIELTQDCYHLTCWCGHEFCYSCGADYSDGQQTCECAFWDDTTTEDLVAYSAQESQQWAWDSLPTIMDSYSDQERSQLALIQSFLLGGFSFSDQDTYQSQPLCTEDSYTNAMKDLYQLPWLERFVSVITDNYYEEYVRNNIF